MSRYPQTLKPSFCYHITTRCNNRDFRLVREECRDVLLYAIHKCQSNYGFKLYALCIMSNHVHYLLEPAHPQDLPKIMHWLNWYTAMCFNRMLNRSGHFWEKRYHSTGVPHTDKRRALNTLRYIHANPKSAKMQQGFFYDYSNYGSYERLTNDGIRPAFLAWGATIEICARAYRRFCQRYKPKPKPPQRSHCGTHLLAKLKLKRQVRKPSPGQTRLPWDDWDGVDPAIQVVAMECVLTNCLNPEVVKTRYEPDFTQP